MVYHVYILASASGVLYTGVTSGLERRVLQHKRRVLGGFTKTYEVKRLVYFEGLAMFVTRLVGKNRLRGGGGRKSWR